MPLLLTESLRRLTRGVALTHPLWQAQLLYGELVLARARSLYLVQWWRLDGMVIRDGLLATVTNLGQLRDRLAGGRREEESVLDPASGRAGAAVGRLVTPLGVLGVGLLSGRLLADGYAWALDTASAITHALVAAGLVTGLLPLVALPVGLAVVDRGYVAQADALGRLAKALDISKSQNPVVKAALELLDEVAALFATLLGAFAVFLLHIAPTLSQLARQIDALAPLVLSLVQMLVGTYTDTVWHLVAFLTGKSGPWFVLKRILAAFRATFGRIGAHLEGMWQFLLELALAQKTTALGAVDEWFGKLRTYFLLTPPIATIQMTIGRLELIERMWKRAVPDSKPAEKSFGTKYWERLEPKLVEAIAPLTASKPLPVPELTLPSVPELDPLPGTLDRAFSSRFAGLKGAYTLTNVFAGRLANLREPDPLPVGIEEVEAFRALAERVVTPGALEFIPRLSDMLEKLSATKLEFPVRALPGSALRPRVQRLRVRIAGTERAAGEAWAQTLRAALQREHYVVPAGK